MSRDEEDMEFEYSLQEIIIGPNSRSQIENNQFKNNLNKGTSIKYIKEDSIFCQVL